VSCFAYSSILKMETTCFSETQVDFQRTTRRYIPEYITLQFLCIPRKIQHALAMRRGKCEVTSAIDMIRQRTNYLLLSLGYAEKNEDRTRVKK
jgi:hypothetical protein